ncbi:MAG: VOC family protein [Thermoplasmata archaeon]
MAEKPKPGSFVHVEIPMRDKEKCKRFYSEVFGWKFEEVPETDYTLFEAPSPPHGGLYVPEEGQPSGVLNYILVTSVDETLRKIEEAGGKIVLPKQEIPEVGWFALFEDPDGSVFALFKGMPKSEK